MPKGVSGVGLHDAEETPVSRTAERLIAVVFQRTAVKMSISNILWQKQVADSTFYDQQQLAHSTL